MTDDFRLVCVQDWMMKDPAVISDPSVTGARGDLAAELAAPVPRHPLWVHAARVSERAVRSVTTDVVGAETLGAATRPRPIGPE